MKTMLYAGGAVALLSLALYWSISSHQTTKSQLKAAHVKVHELDGQLSALNERIGKAAEARKTGDQLRAEVRNESNKTAWGAEPVPVPVAERLCKRASCAAKAELPTPAN